MSIRTDHLHADLPRRSVRSGAVVLVAQAATIVIGIASVAILGRLLTPGDFGIVAIAAAFVAFITTFADHGLPQSIVQREDINNSQVSSLFWLNVVGGILAAIIGAAIAWPVAAWFARPELTGVILVLSTSLIITGLGAPHLALLQRQLRFRTHATIGVVANLLGVIAATIAAIVGWGYWALVVMTVTMAIVRTLGGWFFSNWRPSRPAIAAGIGPMVRFGGYLIGTSLVGSIARQTDRVLIGYWLGNAAAGFYSAATRLILIPATQLNAPLTSVAIPVLSRLQDDHERFREFYRRGVEVIVLALCPFVLVAMVAAGHIVPLALGSQWGDSVPIFRALAPAALVACTRVVTSWVYVPLGRTDRQFRWQVFRAGLTVGAYFAGLPWGAVGVAAAYSIMSILIRIPAVLYSLHGTFVQLGDVISATWRIGVASLVAGLAGIPVAMSLHESSSHFLACVLITVVVFSAYVITFVLTPGGWGRLLALREVIRHLYPRSSQHDQPGT